MLGWLPESVRKIVTVEDSMLNGEFLATEVDRRSDVSSPMEAAGRRVLEDTDDLVAHARGRRRFRRSQVPPSAPTTSPASRRRAELSEPATNVRPRP